MANKKITDVDTVNSLVDSDSLFVNSNGSLKQVSVEGVGLCRIEKLWENASPTSEFASQILTFSGDYDALIITAYYDTGYRQNATTLMLDLNADGTTGVLQLTWAKNVCRVISFEKTSSGFSISFQGGGVYASYAGGMTSGDKYCIPYHIWGVKYVQ